VSLKFKLPACRAKIKYAKILDKNKLTLPLSDVKYA